MTTTFEEIEGGSVSFNGATTVRRYRAIGTPDTPASGLDFFNHIAGRALAEIPTTYFVPAIGVLYRQDIAIAEVHGARYYELTVPFGRFKRQAGAYQLTIDQTGGIVHVTAGTRISGWGPDGGGNTVADGATPDEDAGDEPKDNKGYADNGGVIGKDGEEVRGIDWPIPAMSMSIFFRHPAGQLNRNYVLRLKRLTGAVNSDRWLGFDAGEVRYEGGRFTESAVEATAQYNFAISDNVIEEDNLTIGGIHVKEKKGWDIVSPVFDDAPKGNRTVRKVGYIEIIRNPFPGLKAFGDSTGFGWGGTEE